METTRSETVPGAIRLLFGPGTVAGMSDGQLLDRFLDRRCDEEAAEVAFAALVERHGPMVLRTCRVRLGDEHDAQDAFQATFLILARKAGSIRRHESAASWLIGVARRVAACSRRASAVRRSKERRAASGKPEIVAEGDRSDLVPAVREAVGDLPEKYRAPLLLCLLDGLTHEQAASRLGWPIGTVKTRVRRAKDRLRVALTRRGLAPLTGAIGAALLVPEASAMPAQLVRATARAAMKFPATHGILSASVATLVDLGLRSLIMTRLKVVAMLLATAGVFAAGANGLAHQDAKVPEKPTNVGPTEKKEALPKTEASKLQNLVEIEEALQAERDDRIDALRLDLELLQTEVDYAKQVVTQAMRDFLNAQQQSRSLTSPPPQVFNGGGFQPPTGQALEDAKKVAQAKLEYSQKHLEEARTAYLSKNRELKLGQRRSRKLNMTEPLQQQVQALRDSNASTKAVEPKPTADLDRRLSDVERKLDLILKALEKQGREPGKD